MFSAFIFTKIDFTFDFQVGAGFSFLDTVTLNVTRETSEIAWENTATDNENKA